MASVGSDGRAVDVTRFSLAVPPQPRSVALARLFAAAVARRTGLDEEEVDDIKLAVSEALTNAVKAHETEGVADPVRIVASEDPATLTFEVIDTGPGFDLLAEPIAEDATPPGGLYEGSLGLTVIRSLFPKVEIARNAERGMTVRFVVELERD